MPSSQFTSKPNAETLQKREAQADRADTSIENSCWNLLEFQTYVLRETWNLLGAVETYSNTSPHAPLVLETTHMDDMGRWSFCSSR